MEDMKERFGDPDDVREKRLVSKLIYNSWIYMGGGGCTLSKLIFD